MMTVVCPFVCPVPDPKSRTEDVANLKFGGRKAHDTCDPWPHLEVKSSQVKDTRLAKKTMSQPDDWRIPIFCEISNTDWYVCVYLPDLTNPVVRACHVPLLPGRRSTESVSKLFNSFRRLRSFQVFLGNYLNNFCAMYPLTRYKL